MTIVRKGEGEALTFPGVRMRFVVQPGRTGGSWSLMEHFLDVGGGPGPHRHPWDEAYFVVEGELAFQLGDTQQVVGAGDFVFAPGGTPHGFQAKVPTRLLIFDIPAHSEAFFKDVAREIQSLPHDLPKLFAVGHRHRVEFLTP